MSAIKNLKIKMEALDLDFRKLKVTRKAQCQAVGLKKNEVKLGKIYQVEVIDMKVIKKLVELRNSKFAEIEKLQASM